MNSVFIDTDVILDLYIKREPHHTEALRLFTQLKRSKTGCFTSSIVLANIHYLLSKIKGKGYAIEKIRKLRKLVSVATVDETIIDRSLESPRRDFEDSVQYFCAVKNGIECIITRNTRDFPKSEISIATPSEFLSITSD